MFRKLAELLKPFITPAPPDVTEADYVFTYHPEQLSRWLEQVWATGGVAVWDKITQAVPLGDDNAIKMMALSSDTLFSLFNSGVNVPAGTAPFPLPLGFNNGSRATLGTDKPLVWDHLFYAYLVESTGVIEIMAEVVRRYVTGETLPTPRNATTGWVRATEDLFFRDPPLFRIGSLTSQLRPDAQINRRNAYWRMFGLDLPHAAQGIVGQPWKLTAGAATNTRFLELWNELLRQVWLGIENEKNTSGSKPTDSSYIAYLCQTIGEMLRLRRRGGMLAREEFSHVCMLSWFHLTVEFDSSVILDLSAGAGSFGGNPADRLAIVGHRVGIEPSRQARELFELADLLSPLLWGIELRIFDDPNVAALLFTLDNLPSPLQPTIASTMNRIIDLWQSATGERVKDLAVTQRRAQEPVRTAQPRKLLPTPTLSTTPPPSPSPSTNGKPVPVSR